MKCSSCSAPLLLSMKAAIASNLCPFCGEKLFDDQQQSLKQSIESSLQSLAATENLSDPASVARIASVIVASFAAGASVPSGVSVPADLPKEPAAKKKPKPISREGHALPSNNEEFFAGMSKEELLGLNWEEIKEDNAPGEDGEDYSEWFPESSENSEMREKADRLLERSRRK